MVTHSEHALTLVDFLSGRVRLPVELTKEVESNHSVNVDHHARHEHSHSKLQRGMEGGREGGSNSRLVYRQSCEWWTCFALCMTERRTVLSSLKLPMRSSRCTEK